MTYSNGLGSAIKEYLETKELKDQIKQQLNISDANPSAITATMGLIQAKLDAIESALNAIQVPVKNNQLISYSDK